LLQIGCGSTFRALLPNPWHKNQSQIENSCNDLDKLGDCLNAGAGRVSIEFIPVALQRQPPIICFVAAEHLGIFAGAMLIRALRAASDER